VEGVSLETRRVYEVRVRGQAGTEEALALQGPIARLLCPDERHDGPCEVPWGFTLSDDGQSQGEAVVLVLGVYATAGRAEEVAARVREVAGEERSVSLSEGDPELFEELVEQYRIEHEDRFDQR
jgi:hypothetical protein